MRRPATFLLFAAVAVATLFITGLPASAQQRCGSNRLCIGDKNTEVHLKGAVFMEAPAAMNDAGAGLTMSARGLLIYDFPSIPATGAGSGCQDSAAGSAPGCAFGDTVSLGIDQTLPANLNARPPQAYVSAADAFKIRICNDSNDGGAIDFPDASFTVRCFR